MTLRTKTLVCAVVAGSMASLYSAWVHPGQQWLHFFVYLIAILLSSGMKVAMPKSDGTMCVNFPLILLGLVQLSPYQAIILAAASVRFSQDTKLQPDHKFSKVPKFVLQGGPSP